MTQQEAQEIVKHDSEWRQGADTSKAPPVQVAEATKIVLDRLKELESLIANTYLSFQQFAEPSIEQLDQMKEVIDNMK